MAWIQDEDQATQFFASVVAMVTAYDAGDLETVVRISRETDQDAAVVALVGLLSGCLHDLENVFDASHEEMLRVWAVAVAQGGTKQ